MAKLCGTCGQKKADRPRLTVPYCEQCGDAVEDPFTLDIGLPPLEFTPVADATFEKWIQEAMGPVDPPYWLPLRNAAGGIIGACLPTSIKVEGGVLDATFQTRQATPEDLARWEVDDVTGFVLPKQD